MTSIKFAAALFMLLLTAASPAEATTLDYIFSGTATGSFNGVAFSGQTFTIEATGDSANPVFSSGLWINSGLPTSFTLGSTSGNLTSSNEVFLNTGNNAVVFQQTNPIGIFNMDVQSPTLSGYELTTTFPLTSNGPSSPATRFTTNLGEFDITTLGSLSFEAIEQSQVPLPPSFLLLASALVLTGTFRIFRRRKSDILP